MKASLVALSAILLSSTSMAAAAGWDVTSGAASDNQAGFTAFDFTLNNTGWLTGNTSIDPFVSLDKVGIQLAPTWYTNGGTKPMSIAIFTKSGASTWDYVAKSDTWLTNAGVGSRTNFDFSFSNLTLDSSAQYTIVFIGNKDYFDALEEGDTRSSLGFTHGNGEAGAFDDPLVAAGIGTMNKANHENVYLNNGTVNGGAIAPMVTFHTTQVVPESSSASLSLFGLAAFCCIRKRRR